MQSDLYYAPEKLGLSVVTSIDYSDGNYQFDLRIVWYHAESGKHYTARDSGCSCPTPFENYESLEDLDEVQHTIALRSEVHDELNSQFREITPEEGQQFIRDVEVSLKKAEDARKRK